MSDAPIVGRAKVARLFGISAPTLKRWMNDPEIEQRYRLRDFTFKLGNRWATTPRLAGQFVDFIRSIDPRETTRLEVESVVKELRRGAA